MNLNIYKWYIFYKKHYDKISNMRAKDWKRYMIYDDDKYWAFIQAYIKRVEERCTPKPVQLPNALKYILRGEEYQSLTPNQRSMVYLGSETILRTLLMPKEKIKLHTVTAKQMRECIEKYFPKDQRTYVRISDGDYHVVDFNTFKTLVLLDFTNLIAYVPPHYMCNRFVDTFIDHFSLYYQINGIAKVYGNTPSTYHAWAIIFLISDTGELYPLFLEVQNDKYWNMDKMNEEGYITREWYL